MVLKQKLTTLGIGLALTLAIGTVITGMLDHKAFAGAGTGGTGGKGANGVTDGQQAHGLATACGHAGPAANNPHCGSAPTGGASAAGGGGGGGGGGGAGRGGG